jgi:hypothetical protein
VTKAGKNGEFPGQNSLSGNCEKLILGRRRSVAFATDTRDT